MRRNHKKGLSFFTAGMLSLIAVVVLTYLGFTKAIPFRDHYEIKAQFETSNNLRPNSFVRIAGVNVGKVTGVESKTVGGREIAEVTLRIDDKGLPIHEDARAKIRPRIFLEGNFFVDLQPGTPGSPEIEEDGTLPLTQTAAPVQIDQILTSLQSDTRANLRTLLKEYATGLSGPGALGFQKSIKYWESAYRDSARVNQATLGLARGDLRKYIRDGATVAEALDRSPAALKSLVTDFNTTAAAFASEQENLEAAIAELPRTLRAAQPAFASLNASFPPLRRLIADLRPAVRSSGPAIDATIPFVRQVRRLVGTPELRGLVFDLRPVIPALSLLNVRTVPLLAQARLASSCQNEIILPWSEETLDDPNFAPPKYPRLPIFEEQVRFLPGISGESRAGDANGQWFKVLLANGVNVYNLAPGVFASTTNPLLGVNPPKSAAPPLGDTVKRTACETQEKSDLRTITGAAPARVTKGSVDPQELAKRKLRAVDYLRKQLIKEGFGTRLAAQGFKPLTDQEKKDIQAGGNPVAIRGAGLRRPAADKEAGG